MSLQDLLRHSPHVLSQVQQTSLVNIADVQPVSTKTKVNSTFQYTTKRQGRTHLSFTSPFRPCTLAAFFLGRKNSIKHLCPEKQTCIDCRLEAPGNERILRAYLFSPTTTLSHFLIIACSSLWRRTSIESTPNEATHSLLFENHPYIPLRVARPIFSTSTPKPQSSHSL